MTATDWIGFCGVALLLLAYLLNLKDHSGKNNTIYLWLNVTGAGLACLASALLHYMPFILLEGVWTLVSLASLIRHYTKKQ